MRTTDRRWLLIPLCATATIVPVALTLLLTGASSAPPTKAPGQAASAARPAHRVALPINSEDAAAMKAVLSTALHLPFALIFHTPLWLRATLVAFEYRMHTPQ
jgi:uncharacterized protein